MHLLSRKVHFHLHFVIYFNDGISLGEKKYLVHTFTMTTLLLGSLDPGGGVSLNSYNNSKRAALSDRFTEEIIKIHKSNSRSFGNGDASWSHTFHFSPSPFFTSCILSTDLNTPKGETTSNSYHDLTVYIQAFLHNWRSQWASNSSLLSKNQ